MTGKQAWLLIFGVAIAHELTARSGELLSEEVDRQLIRHRWQTIAFGAVTAAHLYNVLPRSIDPYHGVAIAVNHLRKKMLND